MNISLIFFIIGLMLMSKGIANYEETISYKIGERKYLTF